MMSIKDLEFKVNESWKKVANENSWISFIPEFARDSDNKLYMRRIGSSVVYRLTSENEEKNMTYECTKCDGNISGATVAHSIHDGPFPLSGSGQCKYEQVPYCSNCENEPNYSGAPIDVPFSRGIIVDARY